MALDGGRLDAALGGGLLLAGSHEIYGQGSTALALLLALAAPRAGPILWISGGWAPDGQLHGDGVAELGGDPARFWLVAAPDAVAMLRAAAEALRCDALACVVLDTGKPQPALDLTATRRLQLAAAASGVFTLIVRHGVPRPSAALTRWQVAPAPARRLAAGAPGPPRLVLSLARQRGGPADVSQTLEWNRDRCRFLPASRSEQPAIPIAAGPIGSVFARRAVAAGAAHPGPGTALPVRRAAVPGGAARRAA
jgi:protein ImuA